MAASPPGKHEPEMGQSGEMEISDLEAVSEQVRAYWDIDAATYDHSAGHHPRTALELAAWAGALRQLLPAPPARVLDVGAGTGFLAILLAKHGYAVTALDLSTAMLGRLQAKADQAGLQITTIHADASETPAEGFDAVVERHLLWTMPEPGLTLEAWHRSAPSGRLILVESLWGNAGGRAERLRRSGHEALRRLRRGEHAHHAEYSAELRGNFPLSSGATPGYLVSLVESTSWGPARVERLRDVEWATRQALPSWPDRLIGVAPHFAVVAG
jgi:ubiquinone/menaquinone biosynthesis C-methylase UbiE